MNNTQKSNLLKTIGNPDLTAIHDFRTLSGIWLRTTFNTKNGTETHEVKVYKDRTYQQTIENLVRTLNINAVAN